MPRVKNSLHSRKRRRKVLKAASGMRAARSRLIRQATEAVERALNYAYRDRRVRKRDFRRLWIGRINAAVRPHGLSYSRFMSCLKKTGVPLDRKVLSELAIRDPLAFKQLVEQVQG